MAKNLLVINVDLRETRVALIEDGIIAELHLERASTRSTLGNIVLGKVTRVLPGMQAAFIDIGQERAAFLHVEDLIRPDDFEAYLGGGKRPDEEEQEPGDGDAISEPEAAPPARGAVVGNGVEAAPPSDDVAPVDGLSEPPPSDPIVTSGDAASDGEGEADEGDDEEGDDEEDED